MSVLVIDNYDSFVFNLVRYVECEGFQTVVCRNDEVTLDEIRLLNPSHIILSPGPCAPAQAGICLSLVKKLAGAVPILGVCLGHQSIGEALGGKVVRAKRPMHGMAAMIQHTDQGLFQGLENPLQVGRYHSLVVDPDDFPPSLTVTAHSQEGEIMAFEDPVRSLFGLQFHPESILTPAGRELVQRFLTNRAKFSAHNSITKFCYLGGDG